MSEGLHVDLRVELAPGLTLKNPVLTASGTFGYGEEYAPVLDLNKLGGIVTKGLSLKPKPGNPGVRVVETPAGMLNSIGLQNVGLEEFVKSKMPFLRTLDTKIIVNFFGDHPDEYREMAQALCQVQGIHALEANISCPNVKAGGACLGSTPEAAAQVVERIRPVCDLPLIVKLTPNVTDIAAIARRVEAAGADAVTLINTLTGMAIDVDSRKPILTNITGGLSGPALHPVAVHMVYQAARAVKIPVIGVGGIASPEDALEMMIAGASAVQIGTATFVNPATAAQVVDGVAAYLKRHNYRKALQLVGSLDIS